MGKEDFFCKQYLREKFILHLQGQHDTPMAVDVVNTSIRHENGVS
jgi:hypothetical protein